MANDIERSRTILVLGSDGKTVQVPRNFVSVSSKFQTMVETMEENPEEYENGAIPLPDIESIVMEKILIWCEHHNYDSLSGENQGQPLSDWDKNYLNVDNFTLFTLLKAAGFFEIEQLDNLVNKAAKHAVKRMKPEELGLLIRGH